MKFNIKNIFLFLGVIFISSILIPSYFPNGEENNTKIVMRGIDHYPLVEGDKKVFYISSKGNNRVQYRVFLLNDVDDEVLELTDGYTQLMNPDELYVITTDSSFTPGIYKLKIWTRKERSISEYDYEYISNLNCITRDDNNLLNVNGEIDIENNLFQVGQKINIKGILGIEGKKAPYKYKLHIYDVDEEKWIVDDKEYRESIKWTPEHEGRYILDVWAISDDSDYWNTLNKNPNARVYDAWKIQEIIVKSKPEINFVAFDHWPIVTGDTNKFYVTSKYEDKVQYRAWLRNSEDIDITRGNTYLVDANKPFQIDLPDNLEEGTYNLLVSVRGENSLKKYDNYYSCNINVLKSDENNEQLSFLQGDMDIEKDVYSVGEKININGINVEDNNTYKYKLHVLDVETGEWIIDDKEYRDEIEWIPNKAGTYMLDMWIISTDSLNWNEIENNPDKKLYDGWKLKPIQVIEITEDKNENNKQKNDNDEETTSNVDENQNNDKNQDKNVSEDENKDANENDDNNPNNLDDENNESEDNNPNNLDDGNNESDDNDSNNLDNKNNESDDNDSNNLDNENNERDDDNPNDLDNENNKSDDNNLNNSNNDNSKNDDKQQLEKENDQKYYTLVNTIPELYVGIEKGYKLIINDPKAKELYEKAQDIISQIIVPDMSELEKEIAIHNYIIKNTKYDYENYLKGTVLKSSYNAYGALINGTAVCQGYADAMKMLLNLVGIECKMVLGETFEDHAWCLVKIEGNYYHVDVTRDDSIYDEDNVSYKYFNLSDEEIKKDHSWNEKRYPKAVSDKFKYMNSMRFPIIDGGWIYYSDELDGKKLYKIRIDGRDKVKLTNAVSIYIDTDKEWVYYSNYSHGGYLFKVRKDGIGNIMLNEEWSKEIFVEGEWIYYKSNDENKMYKIKKSGIDRQLVEQ